MAEDRNETARELFRMARERPAITLGVMFGAGILFGYLTGAGQEEPARGSRGAAGAGLWERRARRLRRLSRRQEAELATLRPAPVPLDSFGAAGFEDDDFEDEALDDFDLDDELDDYDDDAEEEDDLDEDDLDLGDEYEPDDDHEDDDVEGRRRAAPSLPAFIREGMQRMIRRDARSA